MKPQDDANKADKKKSKTKRIRSAELPDAELRKSDPGGYLARKRVELDLSQGSLGQYEVRTSKSPQPEFRRRLDHSQVSTAEGWIPGTNKSTTGRKITPGLLGDWWDCLNYWWRRKKGTAPPITRAEVLSMLSGIEDRAQLDRSLGKGIITIRFFADSGSHAETLKGVLQASNFFGTKHLTDWPCGGNESTFKEACDWVMERSQRPDGDPFHMVVVELPPDRKWTDGGCDQALSALSLHGMGGFKAGYGFVTVVMGLSPLHEALPGTADPASEIASQLCREIAALADAHRSPDRKRQVKVLTIVGGAACMAYYRNESLNPLLLAKLGEEPKTEMIHPSQPELASETLERHRQDLGPDGLLVVVPLYFGATRLFSELVPYWGEGVVMVSTDICQDFVQRMAGYKERWVSTVSTDLGHCAVAAVAYAERLALVAERGDVDAPKAKSFRLPVITVRSSDLKPTTPIEDVRQKRFVPAFADWARADEGRSWLHCLLPHL